MAVIKNNPLAGIESVDEIPAPGVRAEHWASQLILLQVIDCVDWHAVGVEVRVHNRVSGTPGLNAAQQRSQRGDQTPRMAMHLDFCSGHSLKQAGPLALMILADKKRSDSHAQKD